MFAVDKNLLRTLIATDSASALHSIRNPRASMNEISIQIARMLNESLKLIWIPGHLGFSGNELADQAANLIAVETNSYDNILSFNDAARESLTWLTAKNDIRWRETNNKLLYFKNNTSYKIIGSTLQRYDRMKINRLRLGHSAYTHGYLLSKEPQQICSVCNIEITVPHIFLCPEYEQSRQFFHVNEDGSDLNSERKLKRVIEYLKDIDIYNQL